MMGTSSWLSRQPKWPPEAWRMIEQKMPRQARALRIYWETDATLADVARDFGVTQERVRQMILRAWRAGRHMSHVWTPERQWREIRDERRTAEI